MHARRLRLAPRGTALVAVGGAALGAGVLLGVTALVQVGLLLLLAVAASVLQLLLQARSQARGALRLARRVSPHPVTEGETATVTVDGFTSARAESNPS